jgi:hypothetical protein
LDGGEIGPLSYSGERLVRVRAAYKGLPNFLRPSGEIRSFSINTIKTALKCLAILKELILSRGLINEIKERSNFTEARSLYPSLRYYNSTEPLCNSACEPQS